MYTHKIANIFAHIQDHSRLGFENKFLENKSGQIFLRSSGLLCKFLPKKLGVFKPTFYNINFIHHIWDETVLFIIHTSDRMRYFTNFSRQIALSQYSGWSIMSFKWNRSKNFQNHPYGKPILISIVQAVSVVECLNKL